MCKWYKGFTVIELLVVIVVIGILVSITIISYNGVQNKSYDSSVQADLKSIGAALKTYKSVKGSYPTTSAELENMKATAAEARIRVNRNAYDVKTPATTGNAYSRNLIVCARGGTSPMYGVAALSKSGAVWFYTETNGIVKDNVAWAGVTSTTCPRLGIATTDTGYASTFGYERLVSETNTDPGWKAWTYQ